MLTSQINALRAVQVAYTVTDPTDIGWTVTAIAAASAEIEKAANGAFTVTPPPRRSTENNNREETP